MPQKHCYLALSQSSKVNSKSLCAELVQFPQRKRFECKQQQEGRKKEREQERLPASQNLEDSYYTCKSKYGESR